MVGETFVTKREFALAILRINKRLKSLRPSELYGRDTYTKNETDALLALQDELSEMDDVNLAGLAEDDVLVYDGAEWKNEVADFGNFDFDEGVLGETVTDIIHALKKLITIEDAFSGVIHIDEGTL